MRTRVKWRLVAVALVASVLSLSEAKAQSISVTGGRYTSSSEVTWNGTFSLPPGVTVYDIDTYIRPSTSGSWTAGMATWGMNGQWTGWWSTNPSAAGSYVFGRLRYMSGSQWYSVDSNTRYIDSPYN